MLTICWSSKGGSGTTVVACAMALLQARSGTSTWLVDLAGDVPAVLGAAEPSGPGIHDWIGSSSAPVTALGAIGVTVDEHLRVVAAGVSRAAGDDPRWAVLGEHLAELDIDVVVDAGTGVPPAGLLDAATQSLLVIRPCYLAVRSAVGSSIRPSGVVVVREAWRLLREQDIASALGSPVVAEIDLDPHVARSVDSGLLVARMPRSLLRLRTVAA